MTVYPSELEASQEAEALLDGICSAATTYLNTRQRARALTEIEAQLRELRAKWGKRWAQYVLEQGRDRGE